MILRIPVPNDRKFLSAIEIKRLNAVLNRFAQRTRRVGAKEVPMYRCMTCDESRKGKPVFIPLGEAAEEIGVCPKCVITIRSYNTLVAQAAGEYDAVKENEAEAVSIAMQKCASNKDIDFDEFPEVKLTLDDDGNPTHASVQAWVEVEFTANKESK